MKQSIFMTLLLVFAFSFEVAGNEEGNVEEKFTEVEAVGAGEVEVFRFYKWRG